MSLPGVVEGLLSLFVGNRLIGEQLSYLDSTSAALIIELEPEATAARTGEQPKFAVASLVPQELQHRHRVGTIYPRPLDHGSPSSLPPAASGVRLPDARRPDELDRPLTYDRP